MKIKNIVFCSVATALLCVLCPITVPITPVPLTFSTLIIYILGFVCNMPTAVISVCLYILLGCVGLPVFSGFGAGVSHILGPTGGFILGYIPLVICVSVPKHNRITYIFSMIIGTIILYVCGAFGYIISTVSNYEQILSVIILPFIPGDILKIIIAGTISPKIKFNLTK